MTAKYQFKNLKVTNESVRNKLLYNATITYQNAENWKDWRVYKFSLEFRKGKIRGKDGPVKTLHCHIMWHNISLDRKINRTLSLPLNFAETEYYEPLEQLRLIMFGLSILKRGGDYEKLKKFQALLLKALELDSKEYYMFKKYKLI